MTARLAAAGCIAAGEEAVDLIAAAVDEAHLEALVARRELGEPLAWITGTTAFCQQHVRVLPGVYVPRFQSEELARLAASVLPPHGWALDLCTGSGAVAVHLQASVPSAFVIGVDIDEASATCARANGVATAVGDLGEAIGGPRRFDVVTAVAPYVPTSELRLLPADVQRYEPGLALDGGPDGLDVLRRIVVVARRLLRPGGWLVLEIGGVQHQSLASQFRQAGYAHVRNWRDDDGDVRGVATQAGG